MQKPKKNPVFKIVPRHTKKVVDRKKHAFICKGKGKEGVKIK